MRYVLCIICPPLAIISCGKIMPAIMNGFFWMIGLVTAMFGVGFIIWFACGAQAWQHVVNYYEDKRTDRIVKAIKESKR